MKHQFDFFLKIILNVLVWASIILIPYLFVEPGQIKPPIDDNLLDILFVMAFFYFNYFLLIKRFLFRQKYLGFISINAFLIIVSLFIRFQMHDIPHHDRYKPPTDGYHPEIPEGHRPEKPPVSHMMPLIFPFLMSLGIAVAIKSTVKSNEEENQRKRMENEHLKSEIMYLKYQIQPHFFFNTLNNIYSLIDSHPDNAKEVLHRLSKLMRFILYQTNNQEVLLKDEFNFIENYVALMKIRTQNNVNISLEIPNSVPTIQIPPLLYIPLVENAFKHGIDPIKSSVIQIWFSVDKNQLHFEVTNTNYPKIHHDRSGSGIGISNLQKRIAILFLNKDYVFEQKIIAEYFITKLIIPINHG